MAVHDGVRERFLRDAVQGQLDIVRQGAPGRLGHVDADGQRPRRLGVPLGEVFERRAQTELVERRRSKAGGQRSELRRDAAERGRGTVPRPCERGDVLEGAVVDLARQPGPLGLAGSHLVAGDALEQRRLAPAPQGRADGQQHGQARQQDRADGGQGPLVLEGDGELAAADVHAHRLDELVLSELGPERRFQRGNQCPRQLDRRGVSRRVQLHPTAGVVARCVFL